MIFKDAIPLILEGNFTNIRVFDSNNKRIMDIEGETAQTLVDNLERYRNQLSTFGRVNFMLATETIKKQNWRDAYMWPITFGGETQSNAPTPQYSSGMISANEAMLMAQLQGLQKEIEFNKKFDELNKKLDEKNSSGIKDFLPFLPMLGLVLDIKPEKLQAMNSLAAMSGAMQHDNAMAGLIKTDKDTVVKGTKEEIALIKSINDNLEKLSEKVAVEKIEEFIRTLVEKPEFLTMLMEMAKNYK